MVSRRWTYEESVRHILSFVNYEALNGGKPMSRGPADLRRFARALASLGHPERTAPSVHIAGTNGKGSTAALLSAILTGEGLRSGLYTSPHLRDMRERVRIDGRPIGRAAFSAAAQRAAEAIGGTAGAGFRTTFEILTALAFLAFREEGAEALVVEAGLGGRLDSTNVIPAKVAVFTPIGLDHVEVLGGTLAAIATDKGGIMKRGAAAVSAGQAPSARAALTRKAARAGVMLEFIEPGMITLAPPGPRGESFALATPAATYPGLKIALHGAHQAENAALAVRAAELFLGRALDLAALRGSLRSARWPGRFQVLSTRPALVVDGAHNPAGAVTLRSALLRRFPGRRTIFVFGVTMGKDLDGILDGIADAASGLVAVRSEHVRGLAAESILKSAGRRVAGPVEEARDLRNALIRARRMAGPDGVVCVAGSLYLAGDLLKTWGAFRSSWEGKAPRVHHR